MDEGANAVNPGEDMAAYHPQVSDFVMPKEMLLARSAQKRLLASSRVLSPALPVFSGFLGRPECFVDFGFYLR